MKKYKIGLLIGRFQPFHKGHLWLLRESFRWIDKLIIGIGSANRQDEENPFTFEERRSMLEVVLKKERWKDKVLKTIPINDYLEDDERWLSEMLKSNNFDTAVEKLSRFKFKKLGVVVGNNEWTNKIFEKAGFKVWRAGFYKRFLYEGEKIRKLMRENGSWQERVPSYLTPPALGGVGSLKTRNSYPHFL